MVHSFTMTNFIFNDGGRFDAGYKGHAADCVARAICIATGLPYAEVWARCAKLNKAQGKRHSADYRVRTTTREFKAYAKEIGLEPVAFKSPKTLNKTTLPQNCIAQKAGHWFAIKDGVINDTYNPSPSGLAKILGYWIYAPKVAAQFYDVYKGDAKMNRAPLNEQQAATMARLFELNYKSILTIKPHEL